MTSDPLYAVVRGPQLVPCACAPIELYGREPLDGKWVLVVPPDSYVGVGTIGCLSQRYGDVLSGGRRARVVRCAATHPDWVVTRLAPLWRSTDPPLRARFQEKAQTRFGDLINPFADGDDTAQLAYLVADRIGLAEVALEQDSVDGLLRAILNHLEVPIPDAKSPARSTLDDRICHLPEPVQRHLREEGGGDQEYIRRVLAYPWIESAEIESPSVRRFDTALAEAGLVGDDETTRALRTYVAELEWCHLRGLPAGTAPAICLDGPPGVGKSARCAAFAHALGRKLVTVSLAGCDDTSLAGASRIYARSLPGEIALGICRAGTARCVVMLDELDKAPWHSPHRPISGILHSLLDPELRAGFIDQYYAGLPLDLTPALIVVTTNDVGLLPDSIRDRLQIIHVPAISVRAKLEIAGAALRPRLAKRFGLSHGGTGCLPDHVLRAAVARHATEPGLRGVTRALETAVREALLRSLQSGDAPIAHIEPPPTADPPANGLGVATALLGDRVLRGWVATKLEVTPAPELPDHEVFGVPPVSVPAWLCLLRLSATVLRSTALDVPIPSAFRLNVINCPADPWVQPAAGALLAAMASTVCGQAVRRGFLIAAELSLSGALQHAPIPADLDLALAPGWALITPGDQASPHGITVVTATDAVGLLDTVLHPRWARLLTGMWAPGADLPAESGHPSVAEPGEPPEGGPQASSRRKGRP